MLLVGVPGWEPLEQMLGCADRDWDAGWVLELSSTWLGERAGSMAMLGKGFLLPDLQSW